MKLSLLPSFFKTKKKALIVPDSLLLKKIKSLSQNSNLTVLSHKEIFHHKESYPIALMLYDDLRGIYIFETKEWSYGDLKNATASKAKDAESSKNTLAFDKMHTNIKKKFNELLHNDGVEIFNYLLMENLSSDEYEHLNDSLQEMLPEEKIIFNDSDTSEIFKKLQSVAPGDHTLPSKDLILGTLFVQYAIVKADRVSFCNEEQREFIDKKISKLENLTAVPKSGKSYMLLLKSIKELFKKERKKIILIKPTILSKGVLHKHLLELIEHAVIDIDLMAFEILTPVELVNRHLAKLKMPLCEDRLHIDKKLMQKHFNVADLIICDNADIIPSDFLSYLKHIQKRGDLLLVNDSSQEATSIFSQSYMPLEREVCFYQTHPYAKALHLISSLLKSADPSDIVVVCSQESREKLQEDLDSFIEDETLLLDASKYLTEQKLDSILLATYGDIVELETKHAILMDLCFDNRQQIFYACNISSQTLHILYREESHEIESLKEKYESNQN